MNPAGHTAIDPQLLDRVRALLAKAESTDFPEEAEAFTAKAQELIARHRIEHALLESDTRGRSATTTKIETRKVRIDDPYARPKSFLLSEVASANGAQAILSHDHRIATVFGAPDDLDAVELLFTSLLVQAAIAMQARGSHRDAAGRSRTRSFRRAFLMSFAVRIGERLAEQVAVATAERTSDEQSRLLPVLASHAEAVEAAVADAFPNVRQVRSSVSNSEGWMAGRAAGDSADLGRSGLGSSTPRGLAR